MPSGKLSPEADIAIEQGDDSGKSLQIETSQLAEKIIQYYWRQVMPYVPRNQAASGEVLYQNTDRQAKIVTLVENARSKYGGNLAGFRQSGKQWSSLVKKVDRVVREMPLWKLQSVGKDDFDFLYDNAREGTTIELRPGVAFCMRQFYGLIGDIVRGAWVRFIRGLGKNQHALGTTVDLHEFLFGSDRATLSGLVPVLTDLQDGACFYCRKAFAPTDCQVDHFVPWSRYPVDLGHNFVLAHDKCNGSKADHIAAAKHLDNWVERNELFAGQIADEFGERGMICDLPTSLRIAEWTYRQVDDVGGLTWEKGRTMVPLAGNWNHQLALALKKSA